MDQRSSVPHSCLATTAVRPPERTGTHLVPAGCPFPFDFPQGERTARGFNRQTVGRPSLSSLGALLGPLLPTLLHSGQPPRHWATLFVVPAKAGTQETQARK